MLVKSISGWNVSFFILNDIAQKLQPNIEPKYDEANFFLFEWAFKLSGQKIYATNKQNVKQKFDKFHPE